MSRISVRELLSHYKANFYFVAKKMYRNIYYLVVTGGSMSGLGKGTTMSSIGVVMKCLGWNVTAIKIDPYVNIDAGTMSPYEHGEVFVLQDGGEVDLDLGNYERYLDITLSRNHNITTGKVYKAVIERERRGDYLGKTVQLVPHITDLIQDWIIEVATKSAIHGVPNICLIEVGGTVGDIESSIYMEALRQMERKLDSHQFCVCHLAYVPLVGVKEFQEFKTKPTQHSVRELLRCGLTPTFIICRSTLSLNECAISKIAVHCQARSEDIFSLPDFQNHYEIATILHKQGLDKRLMEHFRLNNCSDQSNQEHDETFLYTFDSWKAFTNKLNKFTSTVRIGIVGKYTGMADTYRSVVEALKHAAYAMNSHLDIIWIDSSQCDINNENSCFEFLNLIKSAHGILCPGGFGDRGIDGKILATKYCRENKKPFLGICLGLQIAAIEFARNVLELPEATSEEFDPNAKIKVVAYLPESNTEALGGTMRLGNSATIVHDTNSLVYKLYNKNQVIYERHRHRYEINVSYVPQYEKHGFNFVGRDERGQRMEIAELADHPFFICTQFHPEFTSRPAKPNPCYLGFIRESTCTSIWRASNS